MGKIRYLYTAFRLFQEILDIKPMQTGCYSWIEAFKGDAKNYAELKDEDLEKYDVIMVNLDGQDCRLIPDLRQRLGNSSSTKIVANQDYAPEGFTNGFELITDLKNGILQADHVFATSPTAQKMLEQLMKKRKKIYLMPHPCETHTLKRINSTIEDDVVGTYFHRYGGDTITPYIALEASGMKYALIGHLPSADKWNKRTQSLYKNVVPYQHFPDMIKLMRQVKYHLFVPNSYTYGRIPCDVACVHRPMVASNTIWSAQICYPLTTVSPYDVEGMTKLLWKLRDNPSFYEEVSDLAYWQVEFFSHENSRQRFLTMLEENET